MSIHNKTVPPRTTILPACDSQERSPPPHQHPTPHTENLLTCQDSLESALLHPATPAPVSKTCAHASQGGAQPRRTAGPGVPMQHYWRGQISEWATVPSQTGRTHRERMTDLSSCWWKCWTFIWWAVLFLRRLNLRRLKDERHQDYKRLFSSHRNKLVVFTWPSTMNGLHFFDWPKGSHRSWALGEHLQLLVYKINTAIKWILITYY